MSLQLAAQHLASRGRGPDTTLVHMAPGEVHSLQAIAKAHGGSLTVNPDTGLPEAGFLSSILPMIAGVGLTAISGGTLSPVMAGLLTGGATGLATGNLQKGLMAGLGAYGGAGLGAGFANAGAQEAILQANPGMAASEIARASVEPGFVQPSMTDKMLSGVKGLGSESGRDAFMQSIGGAKGLFKSGYSAALPVMLSQSGESARPPSGGGGNPYEYNFNPGYTGPVTTQGGGTRYFDPRFVLRRADGGETYADGGETGMTGQSDEYYRYLMGLPPVPASQTTSTANATADAAPALPVSQAVTNPLSLYEQSLARLTPAELATHNAYLAAKGSQGNDGGELPTPANISNAFGANGLPNAVTTGLISAANALNITSPIQGALQGLPGLITGNPLGLIAGAVLGNAAQIGQMTGLSNIAEGNSNAGISSGTNAPGGLNFGSDLGFDDETVDAAAAAAAAEANAVAEGMSAVSESNGNPDSAPSDSGGPSSAGEYARGGLSSLAAFANGGYNLGGYSDGGRLLRGPGDGVSDSIPASIADKRPARLADGEFVVPARIVSELGNGSTDAGARRLYEMMDRIQQNRAKTVGKGKVAVNSRAARHLPA